MLQRAGAQLEQRCFLIFYETADGRGLLKAYPKMVYCISRCGAGPYRIENEDPPEFGSWRLPMERIPSACLTSADTSRGTVISASLCCIGERGTNLL